MTDGVSFTYKTLVNIIQQAKGKVTFSFTNKNYFANSACSISCPTNTSVIINASAISANIVLLTLNFSIVGTRGYFNKGDSYIARLYAGDTMNGNIQALDTVYQFELVYYNDVEIT